MHPQAHPVVTVGEIIDRLSACDRDATFYLAINPSFPYTHFAGQIVTARDGQGAQVVFLAEAGQGEILPSPVAQALTWHPPTITPPRRRRPALRSVDSS